MLHSDVEGEGGEKGKIFNGASYHKHQVFPLLQDGLGNAMRGRGKKEKYLRMQRLLPLVNKTGANSITVAVCGGNFAGDSFPPPPPHKTHTPYPKPPPAKKITETGGKGGGG